MVLSPGHRAAAGLARWQRRTFRPPEVNVPVNTTFFAAEEMSMKPPHPGARFSKRLTLTLPAASICTRRNIMSDN